MSDRREFLKFLAGSPLLLANPSLLEAFTQAPTPQAAAGEPQTIGGWLRSIAFRSRFPIKSHTRTS